MILAQIIEAFKLKQERNWDKIYFVFDIHGTIFKKSYDNNAELVYYKYAKEALQKMSKRDDICMIMWTCSHEDKINEFIQKFEIDNIFFDYFHENPEVKNDDLSDYSEKFYCNVGFDDKFGFNPEEWKQILFHFEQMNK